MGFFRRETDELVLIQIAKRTNYEFVLSTQHTLRNTRQRRLQIGITRERKHAYRKMERCNLKTAFRLVHDFVISRSFLSVIQFECIEFQRYIMRESEQPVLASMQLHVPLHPLLIFFNVVLNLIPSIVLLGIVWAYCHFDLSKKAIMWMLVSNANKYSQQQQ